MQRFQTRRGTLGQVVFLAVGFLVLAVGVGLLVYALFGGGPAPVPDSNALGLTVPEMRRVQDLPVYDPAPPGYEGALRRSSVHVMGTGWAWAEGANV